MTPAELEIYEMVKSIVLSLFQARPVEKHQHGLMGTNPNTKGVAPDASGWNRGSAYARFHPGDDQ